MKGRIFLFLFALPFFGVGVWMLYSVGSNLADGWRMQGWQPTEARLTNAGYTTSSGDDSDTYEAYATYTYVVGGVTYTGSRVAIAGGGDNIGDYQTRTGNRLRQALNAGRPIVAYVDPEAPADAIIDRDIRWGLIGFKMIFVLVFGGVGLGMLYVVFRKAPDRDARDPAFRDAPWLLNDAWQTPNVRSGSRAAMYAAWGFAAFWNLISAPLPFVLYEEVMERQNYPALFGLLFPVVGLGLLVWAIRRSREWLRFGATPLTLDPFPGSIGGHVGGSLDIRLPYDGTNRFKVTLTCLNSYVSGSGKNRSRKEKATWQDTQFAHAEPAASGTRVTFRFDVPEGLRESDAEKSGDQYDSWRLSLIADLAGADLHRDFDIPVYATHTASADLPERAVRQARDEQDKIDDRAARDRVRLAYGPTGTEMRYPMGRNPGVSFGGFLVGSMFAGAGWYLIAHEGQHIFGGVFGGVGLLIAAASIGLAINSLQIRREDAYLLVVRRVLGLPVSSKRVRTDQIRRFSTDSTMQTSSGSGHTMHYSIYVHDGSGARVCVGEGFHGRSEADAAIRLISREFSLSPRPGSEPDPDEFDALAADN